MPPRKHTAPSPVKTEPVDVEMEREWDELEQDRPDHDELDQDELNQDELDSGVKREAGAPTQSGPAAAKSSTTGKRPGLPKAPAHGAKGAKTPKSPKSPKVTGGGKDGGGSKDSEVFAARAAPLAGDQPGEWTPAKRELFFERIVELGYKHADLGDIADKLGLNRRQLINQLTTGRKGNFRDRAVRCVKGDEGDK